MVAQPEEITSLVLETSADLDQLLMEPSRGRGLTELNGHLSAWPSKAEGSRDGSDMHLLVVLFLVKTTTRRSRYFFLN